MKHLVSVADLTREDVLHLFEVAAELKTRRKAGDLATPLAGRSIALIFEKPSLRTRVTFEVGAVQLGGRAVYGENQGTPLDKNRRVLTSPHVVILSWHSGAKPQAASLDHLADGALHQHPKLFLRGIRRGQDFLVARPTVRLAFPRGMRLATRSMSASSLVLPTGPHSSTAACPAGYGPAPEVLALVRRLGGRVEVTPDPRAAATGADVLYTDVWTSMGQEAEQARRREVFRAYQLSDALVRCARPTAVVMHCLPAHRGEEITDSVLDGPQSIVLDQAENRLHAQKAVIREFVGER